jgi:hypothetical protein
MIGVALRKHNVSELHTVTDLPGGLVEPVHWQSLLLASELSLV